VGAHAASRQRDAGRVSVAKSVRVLHVAAPARTGGLETVLYELTTAMRAHGHDARVATVLSPGTEHDHPLVTRLLDAGVPTYPIVVGTRDYLGERRAVRMLAQRHGVNVMHTHGYRADVMDGGVARSLDIPHVMTLHGFVGGSRRGRIYEWMQMRAARRADGVVAVSAPIAERLRRDGTTATVQLLRNAVSPQAHPLDRTQSRAALGLPANTPLVAWVGRVSAEKGPDVFVRALATASPELHGVIVGDGPLLAATIALAETLGVRDRLHTLGMVADASRYLRAFDALALTSRTEGTPMILLEAMWAGVPIVATSVGGVPDLLTSNDAILCASENSDALGDAFSHTCENASAASERAASARTRVEVHFNPRTWVDMHLELYERAAGRLQR
jgi:glycosyltransferase involved in cell wall biosynthesis